MDKKIPVKTIMKLNDNDRRILTCYSKAILQEGSKITSKAKSENDFVKLT